jgi:type III restriction enzyme
MSDEFKQVAARELEEFKAEYRQRFPGRDADKLTDEDLLREVMNTVGKPGKLGEHVKCVVSVSMLTEGWDANTVTHMSGRARLWDAASLRAGDWPRVAPHQLPGG